MWKRKAQRNRVAKISSSRDKFSAHTGGERLSRKGSFFVNDYIRFVGGSLLQQ